MVAITFAVLSSATAALAVLMVPLPERRPFTTPVNLAGMMILGVIAWMVVQVLPDLSAGWAHPGWTYAPDGHGVGSISIDPDAGLYQLLRFSGYCGMFVAVMAAAADRKVAGLMHDAMIAIVTLYALYGLTALILDFKTVAGFGPVAYVGDVTSTFVNRNSWATYANLGLVLILARLASDFEKLPGSSLRARIVEMLQTVTASLLFRLLAFFLVATASILSNSRGGFLSAAVALPLMIIVVLAAVRPRASITALAVLAVAIALAWIVSASGEGVLARLEELDMQFDPGGAGRLAAWMISLDLLGQRPWLGHGLGSFQAVFQTSNDERFTLIYDLAHNTYIEHMVELGIPATLVLYAGIAILFGICVRGVFKRRRDRMFSLAAVGGTLLVGLHALVDFSIQMPAVAMLYTAMLAIGCVQARPSTHAKAPKARRSSGVKATIRGELEAVPA